MSYFFPTFLKNMTFSNAAQHEIECFDMHCMCPGNCERLLQLLTAPSCPAIVQASKETSGTYYTFTQNWFSRKFATGCAILFPVVVTFYLTWWFLETFDGEATEGAHASAAELNC